MKITKNNNIITISELETTLDLGLRLELGEDHAKLATLLKVSLSAGKQQVPPTDGCWYRSKAFEEKFMYIPGGTKGELVEIPLLIGSKPFDAVRIEVAPWKGGSRDLSQLLSGLVVSAGFGVADDGISSKNRLISVFRP